MMYWDHHMTTVGWIFSILGMLIIFALFVVTIVWILFQLGARSGDRLSRSESAREILDRRLASGEITVDQYDQLRAKLDAESASSGEEREEQAGSPAGTPG
jgi:uncharacterized membrane protein